MNVVRYSVATAFFDRNLSDHKAYLRPSAHLSAIMSMSEDNWGLYIPTTGAVSIRFTLIPIKLFFCSTHSAIELNDKIKITR